jgi:lambda repressor-like predicted transcriptional regulator
MTPSRRFDPAAFAAALQARGIKIPALAREAVTNERYVRGVASGAVPGPDVRSRLARALGVPEDVLWPIAGAFR